MSENILRKQPSFLCVEFNGRPEEWILQLDPGLRPWLSSGRELTDFTDFSQAAHELLAEGWRWTNFRLGVSSYYRSDAETFREDYVIEQREKAEFDIDFSEVKDYSDEELYADADLEIADRVGAVSVFVVAKPLELPSPEYEALARRLGSEKPDGRHSLENYGGNILVAALSDDRRVDRRSSHIDTDWHRTGGQSYIEDIAHLPYCSVTGSDFLSEATWRAIKQLRDQIYNAAVSVIGAS